MQDVPSLVTQAREGRPRAVARLISLVEGASPQLREVMAALAPLTGNAYVVGLTGSPADAEDLVQDVCVKVLAKPRLVSGGDDLGYLLRVLRNTFISNHRTAARRPAAVTAPEDLDRFEARGTDPERALDPGSDPLHPSGNLLRHVPIRHGDPDAVVAVVDGGLE